MTAFKVELLAGLIRYRRKRGNTEREEIYLPAGHPLRTHDFTPENYHLQETS
jgi:hypothetical protein